MKSLLIVESPAKVRTLSKFLGGSFSIKASIGHVKDLPEKELGVDVKKDFKPTYVVIEGKAKILKELKEAAKESKSVFLALDPDREGEAIAWHIAEEINGDSDKVFRVVFNEITEKAVREALKNPRRIDMNLVDAQQARRILDRLVGYQVSPILWDKVKRGLSAGRVQSVAVRLICEREREIRAFVPEEYWSITAELGSRRGASPVTFKAKLAKKDDKKIEIKNEQDVNKILKELEGKNFVVRDVEKKERKRNPLPPFITSTLQQDAVRKLGFTAKKTMMLAQQLYEGIELGEKGPVGLITYMRTDSTRVSSDAVQDARIYIKDKFGKDYLPARPNSYPSKKGAQDAHEAIRPTYFQYPPDSVKKFLSKDHFSLYQLIWNRFVASQMMPQILEQTLVLIDAGRYLFQANGSVVKFPGFTAVYTEAKDEDEEEALPSLRKGDILELLSLLPRQHFTEPPPRFTEATLIKELEENGIGRPSTYALILSTIQERGYARKEKNQLIPTELGFMVTDLLIKSFPDILNVEFTAHMEEDLDKIEDGKLKWLDAMKEFYTPFKESLERAKVEMEDVKKQEIPTDIQCDKCGKMMVIKWGRNGKFLACPAYPKCKNTKEFSTDENGAIKIVEALEETGEKCPNCGKPMLVKTGRFGRFIACSGYPECRNTRPLEIQNIEEQQTDEKCEKCGSPMVLKSGRFGRFLACSNYPECKRTKSLITGIKCPEDGGDIIERRGKGGKVFFGCSNYPRCRFVTWYRPISKDCPECRADFLIEKRTKAGEFLVCLKKGCGYKEETQAFNSEHLATRS